MAAQDTTGRHQQSYSQFVGTSVASKVWALSGVSAADAGCFHVPLVWVRHGLEENSDVVKIMTNSTQVAVIVHVPMDDTTSARFGAFGCAMELKVTSETVSDFWSFGDKSVFTYELFVDGEKAPSVDDTSFSVPSAADPLCDLHKTIAVPKVREVAADFDEATGLSSSSKQVVQYQVVATTDSGVTRSTWHRFSDFTSMHEMLVSCLDDEMVEAQVKAEVIPVPPPKTWSASSFGEGAGFSQERRGLLEAYLQKLLQTDCVHATVSPYVLELLGLLDPPSASTTTTALLSPRAVAAKAETAGGKLGGGASIADLPDDFDEAEEGEFL